MIKTNYHTHTFLCNHAEGHVEDYVKQAIAYGFEELGMADHGFIPIDPKLIPSYFRFPFMHYMKEFEFYHSYLVHIKRCQELYHDQISILAGLECEYYYGQDEHYQTLLKHIDYLALGQHVVAYENTMLDPYRDMNSDNVDCYAQNVVDALDSGYFQMIVHPDVFMFGYQDRVHKTAIFDEAAEKASRRIIEACVRNDVYLELNAGAARKGARLLPNGNYEYYYPRTEFWKLTKDYPTLKIIVGSDAHHPLDLFGVGMKNILNFIEKHQIQVQPKMILRKKR